MYALLIFRDICLIPLQMDYDKVRGITFTSWEGPGMYCYALCAASGLLRAVVHWLSPLPEQSCLTCKCNCCITEEVDSIYNYMPESDSTSSKTLTI